LDLAASKVPMVLTSIEKLLRTAITVSDGEIPVSVLTNFEKIIKKAKITIVEKSNFILMRFKNLNLIIFYQRSDCFSQPVGSGDMVNLG
jgi:hypothetical protein